MASTPHALGSAALHGATTQSHGDVVVSVMPAGTAARRVSPRMPTGLTGHSGRSWPHAK